MMGAGGGGEPSLSLTLAFLLSPLCCSKASGVFCLCCILPFPFNNSLVFLHCPVQLYTNLRSDSLPGPGEPTPGVRVSVQPRGAKTLLCLRNLQPRTLAGVPEAGRGERPRHFSLPYGPCVGNPQDPAAPWLRDFRVGSVSAGSGLTRSPKRIL